MVDIILNGFTSCLEVSYELSEYGLHSAIVAGFAAAVLTIVVLAINLIARRWLTASQMGLLWGLVLLRMAMPIAPSSHTSIHNLIVYLTSEAGATMASDQTVANAPLRPELAYFAAEASQAEARAVVTPAKAEAISLFDEFLIWAPFVWLAGVLFVLTANLYTHWRFSWKVARSPGCEDERLHFLWKRCREELSIRREIPVILCEDAAQPAVMGVWRPQLLLPSHCFELSDDQLRMVMLHELTHIRRYDVAVNWLLVLVRAAQWWNPVFWLAHSRCINLREQSRDAMVLRHLQGEENMTRHYSELLLTLAERGFQRGWRVLVPASLLGIVTGRRRHRGIANRLQALSSAVHRQRRWHRYGVAGLLLAIGLIGLTDAAAPNEQDIEPTYSDAWKLVADGTTSLLAVAPDGKGVDDRSLSDGPSGPWTERDYNVTDGIEIISKQQQCQPEDVPALLKWDLIYFADPRVAIPAESDGAAAAQTQPRPRAELRRDDGEWMVHVYGPPATHRRIERAIHAWNRSGMGQVSIATCIATTRNNVLERAGISWDGIVASPLKQQRPNTDESTLTARVAPFEEAAAAKPSATAVASVQEHVPMMTKVLSPAETKRFLQHAQGDARSKIMSAPKVTLFNGQRAQVVSGVQRPFVTGLKQRGDGTVAPQVEIVEEGFKLSLAVEITEHHAATDVAADLDLSDVKEVQTFSTTMIGKEVTVQVPRVSHLHMNTTMRLKDGQTLVVCIPPTYDRKHYAWVMLTPRMIEEEVRPLATR